jgi:hypothetical protein
MIVGTVLALFFVAGGTWGWWKGTRDLASPPERYDRPIGMGRRDFERRLLQRYRRRRILLTIGGSVGAAAVAFAVLLFASFRRWST